MLSLRTDCLERGGNVAYLSYMRAPSVPGKTSVSLWEAAQGLSAVQRLVYESSLVQRQGYTSDLRTGARNKTVQAVVAPCT